MDILLTGATGFLGSHLTHALINEKHKITVLKRKKSNIERIKDVIDKVKYYNIDDTDLDDVFKNNKYDAVIHTATCYGRHKESTVEIMRTNDLFPLEVLLKAVEYNVPKFINTDTSSEKFLSDYSLAKKHFLDWGEKVSSERNITFINLCLEHMYGPNDDPSKFVDYIILNCKKNVKKIDLTEGKQKRDFIYIDDVVAAFLTVLHTELYGYRSFCVGSGCNISIRNAVEIIHKLLKSKTILNFGAIPLRKNEVLESKVDLVPLKSLGWEPKYSFVEGIEKTIKING
ncbi:NAD(P)-dependent oxidoreductase [Selenomonas ruminantium]|uniref:NAD-dependent epimerase/dehydratase family protein n=1 Tax=Selenomonas ruminantium TaxID=971 RepID=UPI0026EA2010|nr:NAD(P)-dependent oxidoreductase [Selenomonas ruminantium]